MRVLIAEDEENLAYLLSRFLKPICSQIVITNSMSETVRVVSEDRNFDVITYDLKYLDGQPPESIEALKEIRKMSPDTILIVLTGFYTPALERLITEAGADGIIKKEESMAAPEKLINSIKAIVDSIRKAPIHLRNVAVLERAAVRIAEYYEKVHTDSAGIIA